MITRTRQDERGRSEAGFSDCGTFRYALRRDWGLSEGVGEGLVFVTLNPSTADERRNG